MRVIIHTQNGNRPMNTIQSNDRGCLQAAPAQGTVKQFNQVQWAVFLRTSSGAVAPRFSLVRIPARTEMLGRASGSRYLCMFRETTCIPRATSGRPSASVPGSGWPTGGSHGTSMPLRGARISPGVEGIGDYYNGRGDGASGTYFDIAGVTVALNSGLLQPRAGF
ncbi:MAG: hypothetical protein IPM70_18745 [Proteobacteria bacterium]|nr:hypothetical protein [Pseudomonadota bacterium]